ncbi:MAG: ABC transporter substrate-binding protein [Anaerolineae bacterium]|nr:ABC transporter substrate-binding protein [Anaerolineae bacterium]
MKTKLFLIFVILAFTLTACTPAIEPPLPDPVTVQLKWLHGAQFAGLYVADQMGFYAEENITVTLNPGGVDVDEVEELVSGNAQFAVHGAPVALSVRDAGDPIVVIAVIFRKNPNVYFSLTERGIMQPKDLAGHRVMIFSTDFMMPAMLAKLNIGMEEFEAVEPSYDLETLYNGEIDVWTGYVFNQVIRAKLEGYELNIIYPDDYGIHVYSDSLLTTEELIANKPDLVERFLRATLRGWRYAVENPEETTKLVLLYNPELDESLALAQLEASIPLIHTGEGQIGSMKPIVWEGMNQMMVEHGFIDAPVDLSELYTMEFLNQIYGKQE